MDTVLLCSSLELQLSQVLFGLGSDRCSSPQQFSRRINWCKHWSTWLRVQIPHDGFNAFYVIGIPIIARVPAWVCYEWSQTFSFLQSWQLRVYIPYYITRLYVCMSDTGNTFRYRNPFFSFLKYVLYLCIGPLNVVWTTCVIRGVTCGCQYKDNEGKNSKMLTCSWINDWQTYIQNTKSNTVPRFSPWPRSDPKRLNTFDPVFPMSTPRVICFHLFRYSLLATGQYIYSVP